MQVHARNKPIAEDVDLRQIARDLPGLSGAELANVLNEGALEAVRCNATAISAADIYNAIDRILQVLGCARRPVHAACSSAAGHDVGAHDVRHALWDPFLRRAGHYKADAV